MAMLLLPEIFQRTWGITPEPFWPKATAAVHAQYPAFTFMAEVYWDLEWTLQQQGFDYCYDKRLYDRLREGHVGPIRDHLLAGLDYQDKLTRFLENHDEPRAASEFPWPQHRAAAVITYLAPGLRFFHQGQFEGARVRVPTHLCRGPVEPTNPEVAAFYARLLQVLKENWRLSQRRLVADPTAAGMVRQLDLGRLRRLRLGRRGRQPLSRRRQLRRQPGAMPIAAAVPGTARQAGAPDRCHGDRGLRSRRQRPR